MDTNMKYGVYDKTSHEVVRATENELLEQGYEYICGTEKAAYHKIFIHLTVDELNSPLGEAVENRVYGHIIGHGSHQPGEFISQRIAELQKNEESD